jgi:hypothetical protein
LTKAMTADATMGAGSLLRSGFIVSISVSK